MNYADGAVQEICAEAVAQGFRAVKIKVGYPTLKQDIRRVETVRAAVGDEIELMVDANQSLSHHAKITSMVCSPGIGKSRRNRTGFANLWRANLQVVSARLLSAAEAIRRGRAFEALGCRWWEEPIPADDLEGYAALTRALDIPVATGENLYTPADFARFLQRGACTTNSWARVSISCRVIKGGIGSCPLCRP